MSNIRTRLCLALLTLLSLHSAVDALTIVECGNLNGTFIENNYTNCNCNCTYIYCDGSDTQFCDDEACNENYNCSTSPSNNNSSSSSSSSTSTTISSSSSSTSTTRSSSSSWSTSTANPLEQVDVRAACRTGVTQKFRYPHNCNYYYYCINGYLLVEQCPLGYAFDEAQGVCSGRIANLYDCMEA